MTIRAITLSTLLFTSIVGCSTFEGLELDESAPPIDAGPMPASCRHAVPALPSPLPSGPGDNEFVVAVRTMDFGEGASKGGSQGPLDIGFDLDGECTGQGEAASCRRPEWADEHSDGTDGRDNVIGTVLASRSAEGEAPAAALINNGASVGLATSVLRVRGYNGTLVDGDVQVDVFAATRSPDVLQSVPNPALWDGTDVWKPYVEWTIPQDGSTAPAPVIAKYESDRAYVTNDVLVAHFESVRNAATYEFSNAWLQATIVDSASIDALSGSVDASDGPTHGKWALRDGIFAGRLQIDSWLASAEYVIDPVTGEQTCTDSPDYPAEKSSACALADLRASGDDPAESCDAVSWAWRFEAEPALLSDEVDPSRASDFRKCPPELSPEEDSCSSLE
jgi:hypothetical protein